MIAKPRRPERPVASIEDLILAVRRESAAALSTAKEFLPPDAPLKQTLQLPRQFPIPGRLPEDPERSPGDHAGEPPTPDRK